jgi:hypothetical protein
MSIEKDYSNSYESDNNIIGVLNGLMTHWHLKIQLLKKDLAEVVDKDYEYITLYLDDLNYEIFCLLQAKIDYLTEISKLKKKDFDNRED